MRRNHLYVANINKGYKSYKLLINEYSAIPIRGDGSAFFKYQDIQKNRDHTSVLVCKTDEEYVKYKNKPEKWDYYIPKMPGEVRVLSMDVALMESARNDNTSFWLTRLIPDGEGYHKSIAYGESMNGVNSLIQGLRAKQIFYEMECDYFAIDADGVGRGVADILTKETYDEARGETYPAWTTSNPDDLKTLNRTISPNAVPIMHVIHSTALLKHSRFVLTRDWFATNKVHLPSTEVEAIEKYNKKNNYYKIEDEGLRARMLQTYAEINMLIYEATNLETKISNGFYNLVEKPSKRKDRVMSLCYNFECADKVEQEYIANNINSEYALYDFIFTA